MFKKTTVLRITCDWESYSQVVESRDNDSMMVAFCVVNTWGDFGPLFCLFLSIKFVGHLLLL
jgi:hypothetical protein